MNRGCGLKKLLLLLSLFLSITQYAYAGQKVTGNLTVTSLAGTGTRCLQTDNSGVLSVASTNCAEGLSLGTGVATWLATPSSANLISAITDETGSGALCFATSPTLVTPVLGVATATSLNKVAITAPASSSTLTIADGKTLTCNNSITFAGTDSTTMTFPSSNDTIAGLTSTQTLTNKKITKRVVTASDATSITPNTDNADITYQANTQAAGTLTINADSGTPTDGQSWILKIKSTNVQTFSWNAIFVGGDLGLPSSTTGNSKIDYFAFVYDSVTPKWNYTGNVRGF